MTHTAAFDADDIEAPEEAHSDGWLRESIVHFSIATVMVAFGVALRTSFGFGIVGAIVTSLTAYWGLLLVHALVRRGQDVATLSADMADLEEENAALRRMAAPPQRPARVPMPASTRAAARPAMPVLPEPEAPKVAASDDPTRMYDGPHLGSAKTAQAKVAERAPETKPVERGPVMAPPPAAKAPAAPPVTAAKSQPETPTRPKMAQPPPQPESAPAKDAAPPPRKPAPAAPVAAGTARAANPPPLPTARAPFPAAAIALGVAGPERKVVPDRELKAKAPAAAAAPVTPAPIAPVQSTAAAPMRVEPHFDTGLAAEHAMADPDEMHGAHADGPPDPRAQDIAIMQSLIKGLADQLNAPPAPPPAVPAPALEETPAAPAHRELDSVDSQVGALRDVATALRGPAGDSVGMYDDPSQDHGYDHGLLDQIAGAVDAARIDVYLDPILGLDDRKARHFEVSVRLRNDDGELLDPRELTHAIRGTGLRPRIEAYTFTESIQLAGQFAARGADASLFADISAESLRDGGFHDALAGALTPDVALASRLVMSVAQSEIRGFGPAHWDALAAMAQTGLRYALVDVVDLDVDFEAIKRRGFDFVRLDARVFLDGLPAPHGEVPAADLCRYLSRLGFSLIVGRITDERELVKVLGFGALLGQGRLFGASRPVKVAHVARQPSAA